MKIVVTAGGSGGHIMPVMAVAHELKRLRPDARIIYIGQRGDGLSDIPAANPDIDEVHTVWAGKLRRYSDEDWRQWLNVRTQSLNLRDASRLARGVGQSYRLLRRLKPDVIFTRGGFVSVPVAVGGYLNHIPYITHDSDAIPSLANRLIAPRAAMHAVALPAEGYPYPRSKTVTVGVPVSDQYQPLTPELRQQYRAELGLEQFEQVLLLTGGGNGSGVLNEMLVANTRHLLKSIPGLAIVHVAGRTHEAAVSAEYDALGLGTDRDRVQVRGFVTDMYRHSGAADLVITRGSATNLAEFAVQGVACLAVPAKQLGWTVKNATILAEQGAIAYLAEDEARQPERLSRELEELLKSNKKRTKLVHNLGLYAHPHAATELAALVLQVADGAGHVQAKS